MERDLGARVLVLPTVRATRRSCGVGTRCGRLLTVSFCLYVCTLRAATAYSCNDGKTDLMHVFEMSDTGRGQAIQHLRHTHERIYEELLRRLPAVESGQGVLVSSGAAAPSSSQLRSRTSPSDAQPVAASHSADATAASGDGGAALAAAAAAARAALGLDEDATRNSARELQHRLAEAERSRLRRLRASDETRHIEALRSKKRRESLTPAQRQADYERRQVKLKRHAQSDCTRQRREQATDESRERELVRSRERRRNATKEQREREAERSKRRRENTSEEQRAKERERCRKRYEAKKTVRMSRKDDVGTVRQCSSSEDARLSELEHRDSGGQIASLVLPGAAARAVSECDDT